MRTMVILNNLKSILKYKFLILAFIVIGFSAVTTQVVSAKTITSSVAFADDTRLKYFENLYKRSDYDYYLLSIENISNNYSSYNDYYFCLTNENIVVTDEFNASATCDKLFTYYRDTDNKYVLEQVDDNELIINNSVYYTSDIYNNEKINSIFIIGIFVFLGVVILKFIFDDLW